MSTTCGRANPNTKLQTPLLFVNWFIHHLPILSVFNWKLSLLKTNINRQILPIIWSIKNPNNLLFWCFLKGSCFQSVLSFFAIDEMTSVSHYVILSFSIYSIYHEHFLVMLSVLRIGGKHSQWYLLRGTIDLLYMNLDNTVKGCIRNWRELWIYVISNASGRRVR